MSANSVQILGEVVEQKRQESMPESSLADYFEIFSAEQTTKDFEPSFDELESGIVDGGHDGGIDSVYTFVNGEFIEEDTDLSKFKKNLTINFIINQSKSTGGFSEDPLNRIITCLPLLLDLSADYSSLTQYNEALRSQIDIFRNTCRSLAAKFPEIYIDVNYAAMSSDSFVHENIEKKRCHLISILQSMFESANVSVNLLGSKEILDLARKQPNQSFSLRFSKHLTDINGYIVLSKISDFNSFLRNDGDKIRDDLFESNVRDFQGTTEVNDEIINTLRSKEDVNFWWLNNGVTIIASKATASSDFVTIENPQIVNGLQTSSQIGTFFDEGGSDNDSLVMIKIISSEDEDVRDKIIKATNSQNTVPRASLRATDKVQRDIEHTLKNGGYFYDRRKNFYKNQGKPAARIVSIPLLAQAMITLLRNEPDNARARPSSLIKEDSVYESLFSENHPIDAYLVAADLVKRLELALKARGHLVARDRNNIRFYCLFWVAGWTAKSISLNPTKIATLKGAVANADIEFAIDRVAQLFANEGGTDQISKGSEFKNTVKNALQSEIEAHFKN